MMIMPLNYVNLFLANYVQLNVINEVACNSFDYSSDLTDNPSFCFNSGLEDRIVKALVSTPNPPQCVDTEVWIFSLRLKFECVLSASSLRLPLRSLAPLFFKNKSKGVLGSRVIPATLLEAAANLCVLEKRG